MFLRVPNIILSCSLLGTSAFAGSMGAIANPQGLFIGLGGNYSSVSVRQDSWGLGISDLYVNGVLTSRGIAQGDAAPFKNTSNTLSPEIQAGYLRNFNDHIYYGIKFSYQYLGLTATNRDLYLPQTGELRSFNPPGVNSMFGYAIADSVEITTNHNMNLIALIGNQLGNNKYLYIGAGPSLTSVRSQNYNSIGYALVDGQTLNVTGLVNYSSPTVWAWGGAAQLGMSYFISPTWFLDASYTYSYAGSYSSRHAQPFTNTSVAGDTTIVTTGVLTTKTTFKSTITQSVNLSINKLFNL